MRSVSGGFIAIIIVITFLSSAACNRNSLVNAEKVAIIEKNERVRYVYQPNHPIVSSKLPACISELDYMKINDNWYFECEDWN